jgi:hypothetical protein
VNGVRLYGIAVSDINCRLLITALIADGDPEALDAAERISGGLRRPDAVTALSPEARDVILLNIPKQPPSGLAALRKALENDQRARR